MKFSLLLRAFAGGKETNCEEKNGEEGPKAAGAGNKEEGMEDVEEEEDGIDVEFEKAGRTGMGVGAGTKTGAAGEAATV